MKNFVNVRYVAAHLGVSPANVYYWFKESGNPNWVHQAIPRPTGRLYNGYGTRQCLLMWSHDQLSDWDTWYAEYRQNKRTHKDKDMT